MTSPPDPQARPEHRPEGVDHPGASAQVEEALARARLSVGPDEVSELTRAFPHLRRLTDTLYLAHEGQ